MLRVISALLAAQLVLPAASPSVDRLDASARASGNLKPLAVRIGRTLFRTEWPAQVLNVYADGYGGARIAGLRVSGTHFHQPLTQAQFESEIVDLVREAFASAPLSEVDVWATVPLRVGKDVVVSGDAAVPTSKTVFTVSVLRGESPTALAQRLRQGTGIFWDQDWARAALK